MFVLCFVCVTYPNNALHNFNTASSSVPNQSDAGGGVISTGAINASEPGNDNIASYSSRGPTNDGRVKPDITRIDGVSITGAGGFPNPFYGTSAAAPHIAGIAALALQCNPQLKAGEPGDDPATDRTSMRNALLNSATDLGAGGMDNVYGAGRANALAACTCVDTPPSGAPPLAGPAYYHPVTPARILDTRTSTGGFPSKIGQGCHASVQVTGVGGVPASGVTAVVMNTTVTEVSAPSYLTVYPSGVARPLSSNLNFAAGQSDASALRHGYPGIQGERDSDADCDGFSPSDTHGGGDGDTYSGCDPCAGDERLRLSPSAVAVPYSRHAHVSTRRARRKGPAE